MDHCNRVYCYYSVCILFELYIIWGRLCAYDSHRHIYQYQTFEKLEAKRGTTSDMKGNHLYGWLFFFGNMHWSDSRNFDWKSFSVIDKYRIKAYKMVCRWSC